MIAALLLAVLAAAWWIFARWLWSLLERWVRGK